MRVGGRAIVIVVLLGMAPFLAPPGAAAGSCEAPATPSPVAAGTIVGALSDGGSDTWAYDVAGEVLVEAQSLDGTIILTFSDGCDTVCVHHGPNIPPGGLGTLFVYPSCSLTRGSLTVSQDSPSLSGTTHYWLRICARSASVADVACPPI